MNYIQNNSVLLQHIPNVIASVEGEPSLFDKIGQYIRTAEAWLEYRIVPKSAIDASDKAEEAVAYARQAVAAEAFRLAVPSLDLVLTNNGFGVVSNNTVAPASRERVASLVASLVSVRDTAVENIAYALAGTGHVLSGCVFAGYGLQRALGCTDNLLERYLQDKPRLQHIEDTVATRVLSHPLLYDLREAAYDRLDESTAQGRLMALVRAAVVASFKESLPRLPEIVSLIRRTPEMFARWEHSDAACWWSDGRFVNDRTKGGFWLC